MYNCSHMEEMYRRCISPAVYGGSSHSSSDSLCVGEIGGDSEPLDETLES